MLPTNGKSYPIPSLETRLPRPFGIDEGTRGRKKKHYEDDDENNQKNAGNETDPVVSKQSLFSLSVSDGAGEASSGTCIPNPWLLGIF